MGGLLGRRCERVVLDGLRREKCRRAIVVIVLVRRGDVDERRELSSIRLRHVLHGSS